MSAFSSGGQYQVIIGTAVPAVYEELVGELQLRTPEALGLEPEDGEAEPAVVEGGLKRGIGKLPAFLASCM